jgi:hypothetical protein
MMTPLCFFAGVVVGAAVGACVMLAVVIWRDRNAAVQEPATIDSECKPISISA